MRPVRMRQPRGLFSAILLFVFIAQTCLAVAEIDLPAIDVSRLNLRGEIKRVAVACRTAFAGRCAICGRHASLFLIHSRVGRIGGMGKAIIQRCRTAATENPLQ